MKHKWLYFVIVIFVVVFGFTICRPNHDELASPKEETNSVYSDETKEPTIHDFVGKYEFTDIVDHTFVLSINDDKTAQLVVKGESNIFYGSIFINTISGEMEIYFDELPEIVFPSTECGRGRMYVPLSADYIYKDGLAIDAKNPQKRLPIKKVQ